MNYRHIYHAGNFADVAKHVALIHCLDALKRKEAAFFALDTHAGRGLYDLQSAEACKSGEAESGVQRLIRNAFDAKPLAPYLAAIGARRGKRLASYRGSAALIAGGLRAQDRALFVESVPAEARAGARAIASSGRIRTEVGDGYQALRANLPPAERRGLVLIDPPYESEDELSPLLQAFADAYRRFPVGVFLVWYPIVSASQRRTVHVRFEALRIPKMLCADLAVRPDDAGVGLAGSGLMIVNPPFGADEYLASAYAAIHAGIAPSGSGYVQVARLTPERMAE
ncbi:MAG TPA: 23S rRNA (adenine(2030)-N(6))-methyltransferase RlmJ [Steroidobacteraceae bacterium]|nr:23S rRNA (adenine(2030)-N(6))-methyltransferase RlmJ [Steroidobacteraceae bacterium]